MIMIENRKVEVVGTETEISLNIMAFISAINKMIKEGEIEPDDFIRIDVDEITKLGINIKNGIQKLYEIGWFEDV